MAAVAGAAAAYLVLQSRSGERPSPTPSARPADRAPRRSRFAGKVAVVTGASSGIGRAIAAGLLAEQARVIAVDIDADGLAALKREVDDHRPGQLKGQLFGVVADITNPTSVAAALATVPCAGEVGLLVNCAAVTVLKPFLKFALDDFQRVMRVSDVIISMSELLEMTLLCVSA